MDEQKERAYAYLRVSGKWQVDRDGFIRQAEAIKAYTDTHNIEIAQTFQEEGVSGKNELEDREALSAMHAKLSGNGVKIVVIENATRLARDLMIQELILKQFSELGVSVITSEGVDLSVADDDPTRKLIRQVLGAVAEWEKSMLVLKLRAARNRKRKLTGKCEGMKCYGQHPKHPEEVQTLEKMLDIYSVEGNYERVAETLNREGIRTRKGKPWTRMVVWKILMRQEKAAQQTGVEEIKHDQRAEEVSEASSGP